MSAIRPEATDDYSTSDRARTPRPAGRSAASTAALGLGLAGCALALVATFTAIIEIRSVTVTLDTLSGWDRHGPALPLLAVFGALMVLGAARGARPAMAALAAAGVAVLLIAILVDRPDLHEAGRFGETFEATAKAGKGWLFETASGVLMLLAGVLALLLAPREPGGSRRRAPRRPHEERLAAAPVGRDPEELDVAERLRVPGRGHEADHAPAAAARAAPPPADGEAGRRPAARRRRGGLIDRLRGR